MRAVLWDMDGTLADSERVHYLAWQETLNRHGVTYTYERFLADFGRSNEDLLPELLNVDPGDAIVMDVAREKEATFRQMAREEGLKPLPGVMDWLERFRMKGVKQVVSSSGRMANIVASVELLGIADYFHALVSGASLPKSKPDPLIFLNSAAVVEAQAHQCIVVEDSLHGIEAALRAGMKSIAVGQIANHEGLQRLLGSNNGHDVLRTPTLADVSWSQCEELWRRTET